MYSKGLCIIASAWKLSLLLLVSLVSLSLASYFLESELLSFLFFLIGVDICYGYLIILSRKEKGEPLDHQYKALFSGKYKKRSDLILLFLFFGAVYLLLVGPFYLVAFILSEKLENLFSSSPHYIFLWSLLAVLFLAFIKTAFMGAISSLAYYCNEVIEAFQKGFKGLLKCVGIVLLLYFYEIAILLATYTENSLALVLAEVLNSFVPVLFMVFILSSYILEETILEEENIVDSLEDIQSG